MSTSIFGFSLADEWVTDIVVTAKNNDGNNIGNVIINNAPFKRNRATEYSGSLFHDTSNSDVFTVRTNDSWYDPYKNSWQ